MYDVITTFDHSFKTLKMVAAKGGYTLHADKAALFSSFEAAQLVANTLGPAPHYIQPKPRFGFDGINPV